MTVGTLPPKKGPIATSRNPLTNLIVPALSTTVGSKFVVAITGLVLVGFVFAHLAGNLLIFKGPDALNAYARALKDLGPLLWVGRLILLTAFVLHIVLTLRLKLRNRAARPERYRFENTVQATIASRTMVLTGLLILAFVIYHLAHFTFGVTQRANDRAFLDLHQRYWDNGIEKERHDVYAMVIFGFSNIWVTLSYVVAQLILGVHLSHGISSMFQTMGWNSPTYWPVIRRLGLFLTAVLVIGNIAIPVAILSGWVH